MADTDFIEIKNIISFSEFKEKYSLNESPILLNEICEDFNQKKLTKTINYKNKTFKIESWIYKEIEGYPNSTYYTVNKFFFRGDVLKTNYYFQFTALSTVLYTKKPLNQNFIIKRESIIDGSIFEEFNFLNIEIKNFYKFTKDRTVRNNAIICIYCNVSHRNLSNLEYFQEMLSNDRYVLYFIEELFGYVKSTKKGK